MLPDHFSPLSVDIKLFVLALDVLVVLAQTAPDGWIRRCCYGIGRCRKSCKEIEKKKEKCGGKYICCVPKEKDKVSHIHDQKETSELYI
ncbi:PREDICTED: beta-defensin 115 [Cercocebus atys]|uniref:Defensin beta 115 n=1 Tax=Cercocebus atys TaxID=9531 RepID=A0A2K5LGZ3_CERAT|nr:PREDICTED: beta-defensin 115 [Cercocebus atys]